MTTPAGPRAVRPRAVRPRAVRLRAVRLRAVRLRARDDRGSASIWLLGIGLAVVSLAVAVAWAAGVLVTQHRARAAADLGALAGAPYAVQGRSVACAAAARVVGANDARLVDCTCNGLDVTITVAARSAGRVGSPVMSATARAGPERAAADQAAAEPEVGP
jgi:secretion/DNA translocation related TadE-like protein